MIWSHVVAKHDRSEETMVIYLHLSAGLGIRFSLGGVLNVRFEHLNSESSRNRNKEGVKGQRVSICPTCGLEATQIGLPRRSQGKVLFRRGRSQGHMPEGGLAKGGAGTRFSPQSPSQPACRPSTSLQQHRVLNVSGLHGRTLKQKWIAGSNLLLECRQPKALSANKKRHYSP